MKKERGGVMFYGWVFRGGSRPEKGKVEEKRKKKTKKK